MATAQIVQHLRPGGIESLALSLLNTTSNDLLIALEGDKASALSAWPKLRALQSQLVFLDKPAGFSLATIVKLAGILRSRGITRIHSHHIGPYIYGSAAQLLCGVKKHIHTEHDGWHLQNAKHSRIQKLLNRLIKPTLVSDAQQVADIVSEKTGAKSEVIYNGVDIEQFQPASKIERMRLKQKLGLNSKTVWVGSAGRLESVKGHDYLIHALSYLPEDFHLAIAGSGSKRHALQFTANKLGVAHRVKFLGHLDNTAELYQAIDIFCLPSLNEGFPLAPLEAQACAVPSVITNVGGAAETLCPHTGILVPPKNAFALAAAISKQHFTERAHSPRDFVVTHFSLSAMADAYQRLLSA